MISLEKLPFEPIGIVNDVKYREDKGKCVKPHELPDRRELYIVRFMTLDGLRNSEEFAVDCLVRLDDRSPHTQSFWRLLEMPRISIDLALTLSNLEGESAGKTMHRGMDKDGLIRDSFAIASIRLPIAGLLHYEVGYFPGERPPDHTGSETVEARPTEPLVAAVA